MTKKAAAIHGNDLQVQEAHDAKVLFAKDVGIIAVQANQQTSDKTKLMTTGLPLQKDHHQAVGQMDQPVILDINTVKGVTGAAKVTISTSEKHCTGTHIRLTDIAANSTIEFWVKEEHILPLSGLTAGKKYRVEVAYAGTDPTKVWSDPAEFWAQ